MLNKKFNIEPITEAKRQDEVDEISDFGSENNDDIVKDKRTVATKEEARESVQTMVESSVIKSLLQDQVSKIVRVHQFMLMLVLRRRFLSKLQAIDKIQRFLRIGLAKNKVRKVKTNIKEKERRRRMEIYTRLHKD